MTPTLHRTIDGREFWTAARNDARALLPRIVAHPFACLVTAASDEEAKSEAMTSLFESLLASGCRYFVCAGASCARLHDIIDETFVGDSTTSFFARGAEIMTTWHSEESPEDLAFFFLRCVDAPSLVALFENVDHELRRALESAIALGS